MDEEDLTIIKEVLNGNTESFARIIDKYKDDVFTLAVRMTGDTAEAEDISQETFIKAYKKLKSFNPRWKFKNWLYTIATNLARDKLRKKKFAFSSLDHMTTTEEGEELSQEPSNDSYDPKNILIEKEQKERIIRAVNSLPEKYHRVIVLRYMENLSYEEISQIMKCPLGTVKTLLFRAQKMLSEKLKL